MYELAVHAEFCAAHAIVVGGVRERMHGHNWRVTARVEGSVLDADGLLCDFHTVEGVLAGILEPWRNGNLNEVSPFDRLNPTAENVARVIAEALAEGLDEGLRPHAWVASVSVTEGPGCVATYRRAKGA
jgi:6-pyruvoyltetrahydropterin/6-carboxytetrahydropterin synthase